MASYPGIPVSYPDTLLAYPGTPEAYPGTTSHWPAGAAGAFSPLSVTGCVAWFDMQDPTSFTQAGTVTSINNKVSSVAWAEATNPPAYNATGLNSLPAMDFDGTNDLIISTEAAVVTALSTGGSFTLLAAVVMDVADSAFGFFGAGRTDQATDHTRYFGTLTTGAGVWISALRTGASTQNIASTGTPVTTPVVYETYSDTLVGSIQINGAAADPGDASQITGTLTPNRVAIGCRPASTPNVFLNGKVGEIVIYSRLLDSSERAQVRGYLGTRWGITVA